MPAPPTRTTSVPYPLQYGESRSGPQLADSQQVADLFTTTTSGDSDSNSDVSRYLQTAAGIDEFNNQRNDDLLCQPVEDTTTSGLEDSTDEGGQGGQQTLPQTDEEIFNHLQLQFGLGSISSERQVQGLSRDADMAGLPRSENDISTQQRQWQLMIGSDASVTESSSYWESEESTREQDSESDLVCPQPRMHQTPTRRQMSWDFFIQCLKTRVSRNPRCNYIKKSDTQNYKISPQLRGRKQFHKSGKYGVYYDANEKFIATFHDSTGINMAPGYIPTLGYQSKRCLLSRIVFRILVIFIFFVLIKLQNPHKPSKQVVESLWNSVVPIQLQPLITHFHFRSKPIGIEPRYLERSKRPERLISHENTLIRIICTLAFMSFDIYYYLRFFFSLSNKTEVILSWFMNSPIVVYIPYDTVEDFYYVGLYVESYLVNAHVDNSQ